MQQFAVETRRGSQARPAQHPSALGDRIEYGLHVGRRTADDLENLRRRRLPLQRLPGFVEQPRILDRDHRLVGEGLQQGDFLFRKRGAPVAPARHENRADATPFPQQRGDDDREVADLGRHLADHIGHAVPVQRVRVIRQAALMKGLGDNGLFNRAGPEGRELLPSGTPHGAQVQQGILVDRHHGQIGATDQPLATVQNLVKHRLGVGH